MRILIGTDDGLMERTFDGREGGATEHPGRTITALGTAEPDLLAIVDEGELWRRSGGEWSRIGSADGHRGNCVADTRAGVVVGTSEARMFRAGSSGLEPVDAFDRVEGRDRWYTPWGGPPDVRTISEDSEVVYANVHVGGIVRTADGGASWEPTIDIDADVHRVWAADQGVFAACAWGLAQSSDRGDSWAYRTEGLHATYCRAVALCGAAVLVSASNGPRGGRSALYRGAAAGGALERCTDGLPEWFGANIDSACLDAVPDDGGAAFSTADGSLYASSDEGRSWEQVASDLPPVQCLLVMP